MGRDGRQAPQPGRAGPGMTDRAAELARCDREIAEARAMLLAGEPHEDALLVWLRDWTQQRKWIEREISAGERPL